MKPPAVQAARDIPLQQQVGCWLRSHCRNLTWGIVLFTPVLSRIMLAAGTLEASPNVAFATNTAAPEARDSTNSHLSLRDCTSHHTAGPHWLRKPSPRWNCHSLRPLRITGDRPIARTRIPKPAKQHCKQPTSAAAHSWPQTPQTVQDQTLPYKACPVLLPTPPSPPGPGAAYQEPCPEPYRHRRSTRSGCHR